MGRWVLHSQLSLLLGTNLAGLLDKKSAGMRKFTEFNSEMDYAWFARE